MESENRKQQKEVGKVKPIRIQSREGELSLKLENMNNLNAANKKWRESEEEEVSLLENASHTTDLVIQPIDPTKDFYTSSGRPVSPTQLPPPPLPDEDQDTQGTQDDLDLGETITPDTTTGIQGQKLSDNVAQARNSGASERVKVVVRSRPLSQKEKSEGHECVVHVHPERSEVEVRRPKSNSGDISDSKVFAFDAVFDVRTSQMELYNTAFATLVDSVLQGFNGTIFAYGQTGTGKTYTMEGVREKESEHGVIPNTFRHIFHHVAENSNKQYLIRASYLEIYQEEIRDLLVKDRKQHRELRESPSSGVYVKDLSTYLCSNLSEINDLMTRGNKNRAVGSTNMNEHSSRSHAIFMVTIEMSEKWADGRNHFKVGKLNLVDLAGSERQGKTGAAGDRFKEATKINLSLSALGNVIAALVDAKSSHIPYRDSKLTRLLQDSLGGNSRTIMVATIGPANFNWEETITTLRYASRAKKIKNKPKVNEDPKDALLRQYQEEIERLRVELEQKKTRQMLSQKSPADLDHSTRRGHSTNKSSRSHHRSSSSNVGDAEVSPEEEQRLRELTALLEPFGLDPTTDPSVIMEKLAERRKELLQDNLTMQVEKDKLLSKLDETEDLVRNTEQECSKLSERIGWLESKVLTGGKDLVDHTNEQRKLLQAKQVELAEQLERYEEMKKRLEEEELTMEELRVNADAFEGELQSKARKYKKLTHKCQSIKEETEKAHDNHSTSMKELETVLMELKKEFALKTLILDNFIPITSRQLMEKRMRWDDHEQAYKLAPIDATNAIQRPPVVRNMTLPLFNISESGEVLMVKNVHYSNENILQLHPEMPQRRTRDYVPPSTDPLLSSLLRRAIDDVEKEIVLDCSPRRPNRSSTAKMPIAMDYFQVGDNLVRRLKSARPPSDGIFYHDFAIVSRTRTVAQFPYHILTLNAKCTSLEMLHPPTSAIKTNAQPTATASKNVHKSPYGHCTPADLRRLGDYSQQHLKENGHFAYH